MKTLQEQHALLKFWADGTDFVLDAHKSPKAEFARLAQRKRWIGGDANWKTHWQACFEEAYSYGVGRAPTTTATMEFSAVPAPDLVDRMRRLSVGSDTSEAFSVISSVLSVHSLESMSGGVMVDQEPEILQPTNNDDLPALATRMRSMDINHSTESTTNAPTSPLPVVEAPIIPRTAPASDTTCSPYWFRFSGFVPNPTVTFKNEFVRLAKHQSWDEEMRRTQKVEALMAEVNFYYGTCMNRLESWQELCSEVRIEKIPTSITQCKKALKSVYVNLFNVIDHRRNPEFKVKVCGSYAEFVKYTRNGRTFPRACAKQGGFIKVFLRRI